MIFARENISRLLFSGGDNGLNGGDKCPLYSSSSPPPTPTPILRAPLFTGGRVHPLQYFLELRKLPGPLGRHPITQTMQ